MRTVVLVGGLCLLLCGCGDRTIDQAESALRSTLKDPESAQFKDVTRCGKGVVVKGSVNAKNSYGGYTGYKYFYSDGQTAGTVGDDDQFDVVISLMNRCTSEILAAIPKPN